MWSPDGKQIFYVRAVQGLGQLFSVDVRTEPTFSFANPARFPIERLVGGGVRPYDITPDGKQFIVMVTPTDVLPESAPQPQINITLNFAEELKQRVR